MKKLLAILLALMLPVCATAEAYSFTFDVKTGEAFLQYVENAMRLEGAEAAEATEAAQMLQSLVNGMGMDLVAQEDAFDMQLRFSGEELMDLTAYETNQELMLTSSLIPGYALSAMQESDAAQAAALEQIDWVGAALSVLPSVTEWCNTLKSTEAQGSFVGDAYEGGVKCTTWSVDDQAVATLVDAVLTEDVCAVLKAVFAAMEMDADAILSQIREQNKLVAQENLHTYLLRWVQDAQDQPVGASLTVLKNGEQIATISMGFQDDGCRMVIGLGFDTQNYWCESNIQGAVDGDVWLLTCRTREWAADKENAFAYISAVEEPETDLSWSIAIGAQAWECVVRDHSEVILTANGTLDAQTGNVKGQIVIGTEAAPILTVEFAMGPTTDIQPMSADVTKVSADAPEDADQYEQLIKQLTATLMARLIKLLPLQMLLEINPFTMP